MSITFEESGMLFGPYPTGDCFHLEGCKLYQRIQKNTLMAEFALVRREVDKPEQVWVIEAKSSVPNAVNDPKAFDKYFDEVRQKMVNALQVMFAAWLQRHSDSETGLSPEFAACGYAAPAIRCILVIKGPPKNALPPLNDALSRALHVTVKTMGLPPGAVKVINDVMAKSYGLIQ